jgi:hypothetical protein
VKGEEGMVYRLQISKIFTIVIVGLFITMGNGQQTNPQEFSLEGLSVRILSPAAREILQKNGFIVYPGYADDMEDAYNKLCKDDKPVFVTTDAMLHTAHIFFDYLLRIIEIEKLDPAIRKLTDLMLEASGTQYAKAKNPEVKEAARLNIGFFSVAKSLLDEDFKPSEEVADMVKKEIGHIMAHEGIKPRALLPYVKNPNPFKTPYAFEDYSQYVPRGHYTRNETFERYFRTMMWYGRVGFILRPGLEEPERGYGRKMTLQALLITDALLSSEKGIPLWKTVYEPTVFFVGKADDLAVEDYKSLIGKVFPKSGGIDRYADTKDLDSFIEQSLKLMPPRILSSVAIGEDEPIASVTMGFRFMGQRFIPDSYILGQLVYGASDGKLAFRHTGSGKPFTMENLPNVGPARAFPRGLDVFAVLGSERALEILNKEGDTAYTDYDDQMKLLRKEFSKVTVEKWNQNLYWRWLHSLLPVLELQEREYLPAFMRTPAWLDKCLNTTLGSWAELRHDTILYAKQSYTAMALAAMPLQKPKPYGFVEPYPEVYSRLRDMMTRLKDYMKEHELAPMTVTQKVAEFETLLNQLIDISEKELDQKPLSEGDYVLLRSFGARLKSLAQFPRDVLSKITSDTDSKMSIVADVHTEINTRQVLEEAVGHPFNIMVIVEDDRGRRVCNGAVFSYYEFKHPMRDRLTDEKWQLMLKQRKNPPQPEWVKSFMDLK